MEITAVEPKSSVGLLLTRLTSPLGIFGHFLLYCTPTALTQEQPEAQHLAVSPLLSSVSDHLLAAPRCTCHSPFLAIVAHLRRPAGHEKVADAQTLSQACLEIVTPVVRPRIRCPGLWRRRDLASRTSFPAQERCPFSLSRARKRCLRPPCRASSIPRRSHAVMTRFSRPDCCDA